uniref:MHC class II beta chain N-terminal domain-containing protein n=1 Tax=Pseudonaja textilis TaxID=8673 RepID=A0A670Z3S0_PSETE
NPGKGGFEGMGDLKNMSLDVLLVPLPVFPAPPKGRESRRSHFLYQGKAECLFLNGTQRVRYLERHSYDRQEFLRFDSDLGKFVAVTALGEADADYWNGDKQIMQYQKAEVDRFCRYNYEVYNYEAAKREERVIGRRGESWGREGLFFPGRGRPGPPFPFLASTGDSPPG